MRDEFVAVLAEELQTRLSSILGFSRTLELQGARLTPAEREEFAGRISELTERLCSLTEYLRVSSRAAARQATATEVAPVVHAAVDGFAGLAEAHDVAVETRTPEGVQASIAADVLRQVLVSLLLNALEVTRHGSTVHVSVSERSEQVALEVTVADAVLGADQRERVPGPLGGTWTTPLQPGPRGELGLYVVRPLVEANGGEVEVSLDGSALRFCLLLRRPRREGRARDAAPGPQGPHATPLTACS